MSGVGRYRKCLLAGIALGAFGAETPARAADIRLPVKAPAFAAVFNWTGFYIGAHAGYGRGASDAVPPDPACRCRACSTDSVFSGVVGG